MALVPDQKFSTFQNGGDLEVGDIIVGLRGGLNTRFNYTGDLPVGVIVPIANGGTGATTATTARANLGLGTMAVQNATAVAITGGTVAGVSISGATITASTAALTSGSVTAAPVSGTDITNKTYVDGLAGGLVDSVTGTLNRITVDNTDPANPIVDISASYVGQASITTLGTVTTGVWNGTAVTVPYGGTGITSATAYAVLCGGTTSTGAFQSVASVGNAGEVLTSNGAGALPTFQSIPGGGTVNAGLQNELAWYAANGTAVSGLTTANNGVLVTSAGGVPSISSTLPAGISASGMLLTSPRLITSVLDTNGNNLATITATGSAVNYMTWANAAASGNPVIGAAGSDANIQLQLSGKGTSGVITQGITSGSNAPAGYRGEIISAAVLAASGVAMTTSTSRNITSISLTAGNWLVLGVVSLASGTSNITQAISWCSLTSATLPDNSIRSGQSSAATSQFNLPTAPLIVNTSSTVTCYLEGYAVFASGSVSGSGYIVAIRL